jgi:hypothetical protein
MKPAAKGRDEMRALASVENMDLHPLTDQGEDGRKSLVEGHCEAL